MRRRTWKEESQHQDRWLVSYSDLVTLLFALFVVLFASAYHDRKSVERVSSSVRNGLEEMRSFAPRSNQGAGGPAIALDEKARGTKAAVSSWPAPVTVDMEALRRDIEKAFGREIENREVAIRETPEGFVISLREVGFFNSGEAKPLPGAQEKVRKLALVLMNYGLAMRIEGHTDNTPIHNASFKSNWDLSAARAMEVSSLLLKDSSVDPRLISIAAYGEYHPVASNDTPEGRRANRRVDVVVLSGNGSRMSNIR